MHFATKGCGHSEPLKHERTYPALLEKEFARHKQPVKWKTTSVSICFPDRRPDLVILTEILSNNRQRSKKRGRTVWSICLQCGVVVVLRTWSRLGGKREKTEEASENFTKFALWIPCCVMSPLSWSRNHHTYCNLPRNPATFYDQISINLTDVVFLRCGLPSGHFTVIIVWLRRVWPKPYKMFSCLFFCVCLTRFCNLTMKRFRATTLKQLIPTKMLEESVYCRFFF